PASIARASGQRSAVVVCPRIDNPENLGAVVRIADVFGADAVLAGGRCPDPLSRRVLRVSMGSALRGPVVAPHAPPPPARPPRRAPGVGGGAAAPRPRPRAARPVPPGRPARPVPRQRSARPGARLAGPLRPPPHHPDAPGGRVAQRGRRRRDRPLSTPP